MTGEPSAPGNPGATGLVAGAVVAVWFFWLSGFLDVVPGRPAANRCDVVFQSDAGQRILDARTGTSSFGFGSHAVMSLCWPRGLRAVSTQFPDPDGAAVYAGRAAVAATAGAGVGVLVAGLAAAAVRRRTLAAFGPVFLAASSHAVACLPDHFGVSVGVLSAAFGVYLLHWGGRLSRPIAILSPLAVLAAGVCLTNALLPLGLIADILLRRYRPGVTWRTYATAGLLSALGFVAAVTAAVRAGEHAPLAWQVNRWLNLRIVNDPAGASKRIGRAWIEPVIGPQPSIDTNNFFGTPMLTYEPSFASYRAWPYSVAESVPAASWLVLLGVGLFRGLKETGTRGPVLSAAAWVIWNAVFHNVWGDEFFLYSPHYGWALWAAAVLGWKSLPVRPAAVLSAVAAAGGVYTLAAFRQAILQIPS